MKKDREPAIIVNRDIEPNTLKEFKPDFVRSSNNYDANKVSDLTSLRCKDPTLTQQQFAEEVNINFIAERYGLTGELPQVLSLPRFGDFEGVFDFQTAQNAVVQAKEQFMTLPAKMRAKFDNDPQKLLMFLEDPENRPVAEAMGLVQKRQDAPESTPGGTATSKDKGSPTPPKAPEQPPAPPKKDT